MWVQGPCSTGRVPVFQEVRMFAALIAIGIGIGFLSLALERE
jgi:hypothetical protein